MAIQDNDRFYSFLRYYVDAVFFTAYQRSRFVGLEKIPKDGSVIFAPNHTNCLQDALAVLVVGHGPKVFVARADIFKKPLFKKILTFLKILPINRIRDGFGNLSENDEIMETVKDVIKDDVPFCIMAEGRHRPKHSLLPLLKGIFRIALRADDAIGGERPVYIVPVGVEYGNYFRFRSSLIFNVGDPINVTEFLGAHADEPQPVVLNELKDVLSEKMKSQILFIPDDEWYDSTLEICYLLAPQEIRRSGNWNPSFTIFNGNLVKRLEVDQEIASKVAALRAYDPDEASVLLSEADEISALRRSAGISANSLVPRNLGFAAVMKVLTAAVSSPLAVVSAALASPILLTSWYMGKGMKDKAFMNSFRYVVLLAMLPILVLVYGILGFIFLKWWLALSLIALTIFSHTIAHDWFKLVRLAHSDIKLILDRGLRAKQKKVKDHFRKIFDR